MPRQGARAEQALRCMQWFSHLSACHESPCSHVYHISSVHVATRPGGLVPRLSGDSYQGRLQAGSGQQCKRSRQFCVLEKLLLLAEKPCQRRPAAHQHRGKREGQPCRPTAQQLQDEHRVQDILG